MAAIKEDNSLIILKLVYERSSKTLFIETLEHINEQVIKIRKILSIEDDAVFIAITIDDSFYINGFNQNLIELCNQLKDKLVNIDDIVLSYNAIGILKKDNSIILIKMEQNNIISFNIYESINSKYIYNKIISTYDKILALTSDKKVYILKDRLPIELFNNIQEVYVNHTDIILISTDNIVYAYNSGLIYQTNNF